MKQQLLMVHYKTSEDQKFKQVLLSLFALLDYQSSDVIDNTLRMCLKEKIRLHLWNITPPKQA